MTFDTCVQLLYNNTVRQLYTEEVFYMSTVTFRVTDEEKLFIESMANLNGLSLSELSRTKLLEALENQVDMDLYKKAIADHELLDESISHHDMLLELGL